MNASKVRFGAGDLEKLFADAATVVVARGKKVLTFDMKRDPPSPAEFEKVVLGPSGNLRAPAIRAGRTWFVGFHPDPYGERFGA